LRLQFLSAMSASRLIWVLLGREHPQTEFDMALQFRQVAMRDVVLDGPINPVLRPGLMPIHSDEKPVDDALS
jgi:hypothetical protein